MKVGRGDWRLARAADTLAAPAFQRARAAPSEKYTESRERFSAFSEEGEVVGGRGFGEVVKGVGIWIFWWLRWVWERAFLVHWKLSGEGGSGLLVIGYRENLGQFFVLYTKKKGDKNYILWGRTNFTCRKGYYIFYRKIYYK